jgi:hypothetical protein
MPDDQNFFAGLVDFSFQQVLARRIVKLLYILGILAGGIYVVYYVVVGFQQSPADGLIALVAGIVALFVGILIWRVLLELTLVIIRISDGIDRATHPGT